MNLGGIFVPKSSKRKKKALPKSKFEEARQFIRKRRDVMDGLADLRTTYLSKDILYIGAQIASHPAYKRFAMCEPFPTDVGKISHERFRYISSFSQMSAWLTSIIGSFGSEISKFLIYRKKIEEAFLLDDFEVVISQIEQLESELGVSIWSIENRLRYYELTGGSAEKNKYLLELRSSKVEYIAAFLINWSGFRINSTLSRAAFDRMLISDAPLGHGLFYLLQAHNGRYSQIDSEKASEMLFWVDNLPLIDRYEFLLLVSTMLQASTDDDEVHAHLCTIVGSLRKNIDDVRLDRLGTSLGQPDASLPKDEVLQEALRIYSKQQYDEVISYIEQRDLTELSIEHLNLLARSSLRASSASKLLNSTTDTTFWEILKDLKEIQSYDVGGVEARLRLQKLASVHCNTSWGASISLILGRQSIDEKAFRPSLPQLVRGVQSQRDHPLLAFVQSSDEASMRYLRAIKKCGFDQASIDYCSQIISITEVLTGEATDQGAESSSLTDVYRLARQGHAQEAAERLSYIQHEKRKGMLQNELATLSVRLLLEAGDIYGAASGSSKCYLMSRFFATVLPVQDMIKELLLLHDEPMATSKTRGAMSVAIMYDIHSRNFSSENDVEKADAFKDVLKREGVELASELNFESDAYSMEELQYFLQFVATPNVLDQCLNLKSTRAVEDERVAILLKLDEIMEGLDEPPAEALKEELRDIRTRQVVRETSRQLDQSKIYVNVEAIRRAIDVELRETWNRYILTAQDPNDEKLEKFEQVVKSAMGEKVQILNLTAPSTKRSALFQRMVLELGDQFTSNKEFGLNANLSTNIRHGYVLRELRSPLTSLRIVTNKGTDSGSYLINTHWNERLSELDTDDQEHVQTALAQFSTKIDDHIAELNRQKIRVRSQTSPNGLFIYHLSKGNIDRLYRRYSKIEDYEEFITTIIGVFWQATEQGLDLVRKHLEKETLVELHSAVDELEARLLEIPSGSSISALLTVLPNAKIELRHAVERVSSWFTLAQDQEYQDYNLRTAFEAGLQTVESYYSDIQIEASFNTNQDRQMEGWTLPYFARLFDMLLDNAGKHGAKEHSKLIVSVDTSWDDDILMLNISNTLGDGHDLENLVTTIKQINREYGKEAARDLVGEEGGSGYAKIWKILRKDLGLDHDLRVFCKDGIYNVEILIGRGAKI